MAEQNWTPTVRASHDFRADVDAQNLYDAIIGGDLKLLVEILCKRSNFQRQLIKAAYEHKYKQTLEDALHRVTKGDFEETLDALLDPPDIYDAKMVNKSLSSRMTSEVLLADILCTKNNDEIRRLQNAFRSQYGKSLVEAVEKGCSGDLKKLLVPIANAQRSEDETVVPARARQDAEHLYKAGEKKWGTNEDTFQAILGVQNNKQIEQIMREYEAQRGHSLAKAIAGEFSGPIKEAYLAILQCTTDHHVYFANALYHSMKGLGTNDDRLMWLAVSRAEIDLGQIKATFEKLFNKPLAAWVQGDTSGVYRDTLLAIIEGNHH